MTDTIRDVMTTHLVAVDESASLRDVATLMRDNDIGDVIVRRGDELCGIVTDRDLVVRGLAEGQDPAKARAGDICSGSIVSLSADESFEAAARKMAEAAVRRLPVTDGEEVVGIVSLGDLAREREPHSVLGALSAKPPTT